VNDYDDIIQLPHHVSATRPPMPRQDRAAQFSPFAALTGYAAATREAARRTEEKPLLDTGAQAELNRKLQLLAATVARRPELRCTYFQPDDRKEGGAVVTVCDTVVKVDPYAQQLFLGSGAVIPFAELLDLAGEIFAVLDGTAAAADDFPFTP